MTITLKPHETIKVTGQNVILGTNDDRILSYNGSQDTLTGSGMTFIGSTNDNVTFTADSSNNVIQSGANLSVWGQLTNNEHVVVGKGDSATVSGLGLGGIIDLAKGSSLYFNKESPGYPSYNRQGDGATINVAGISQNALNTAVKAATIIGMTASSGILDQITCGSCSITIASDVLSNSTFHAIG